jgi:hypothetical protein
LSRFRTENWVPLFLKAFLVTKNGNTALDSKDTVGRWFKAVLLASVAAIGASSAALAQDFDDFSRNRNTGVRDRARPDFDAVGIDMAPFLLLPRLDLTTEFDDNILATETNTRSDFIFRIRPEATLKSEWVRHELDLSAYADINRYAATDTENTVDYGAKLNGRVDAHHWTTFTALVSYDHLTESRGSQNTTVSTVSPVEYGLLNADVAGIQQFSFFKFQLSGHYTNYEYQNGVDALGATVFEHDRNFASWEETGRVDYALTPDESLYVSGTLNQHSYDLVPPSVSLNRDSTGFTVLGGYSFDLTNLVTGDIGLGYFQQTYDHLSGQDAGGFTLNGDLKWFPTQLTTVSLSATRRMQDTAVGVSAGYITTGGTLQIDQELRRWLILTATASYNNDAYQGIDRNDERWGAGISATYLLNRYVGVSLGYTHSAQRSTGADRFVNFDDNKLMISLVLQK